MELVFSEASFSIDRRDESVVIKNLALDQFLARDLQTAGMTAEESAETVDWVAKGEYRRISERALVVLSRYMAIAPSPPEGMKTSLFYVPSSALYLPTYRRLEIDLASLIDEDVSPGQRIFGRGLVSRSELKRDRLGVVVGYSNEDIDKIIRRRWAALAIKKQERLRTSLTEFIRELLSATEEPALAQRQELDALEASLIEGLTRTNVIGPNQSDLVRQYMNSVRSFFQASEKQPQKGTPLVKEMFAFFLLPKISSFSKHYQLAQKDIDALQRPFNNLLASLKHFLEPEKSVQIEEDGALTFLIGSRKLTFESLSAGEKQLVSLFVYLALEIEQREIILIDEPELSLHVRWQRDLIEHLELLSGSTHQIIAATHSPFVASKHRAKMFALGELDE